jgi:hypothetical protein
MIWKIVYLYKFLDKMKYNDINVTSEAIRVIY